MRDYGLITIKIPPEIYVELLEKLDKIDWNAGDIFHTTLIRYMDNEGWAAYHDFYYTRIKENLGLEGDKQ